MTTRVKCITPEGVLSFPALLEARKASEDAKPKFGVTLLFYPDQVQQYLPGKADLKALKAAVAQVAQEEFGKKLPEMIKSGKFKSPFLSDEEQIEKYGWPEGTIYLRLSSLRKPGVVSGLRDANGKPTVLTDQEIEEKLYPGARVRCSVRPFAYDVSGNRGVSFDLQNVQLLGDGERIDGRSNAEDEFEATTEAADLADSDAPAEAPAAAPAKAAASIEDML